MPVVSFANFLFFPFLHKEGKLISDAADQKEKKKKKRSRNLDKILYSLFLLLRINYNVCDYSVT